MSNIFSALDSNSLGRLSLFNTLVEICTEENKTYLLTPYLSKIRNILPWESLTLQQKVDTYNGVIEIVKQKNDSSLLYEQIRQLLEEFDGASKDEIITHKDLLATCIIDIIQNDEHLFELGEVCELDQVKLLLAEMGNLKTLIAAITSGDVSSGDDLFEQNKALLKKSGMDDKEDLKNKLRYSCITTIADENKSMNFSDLAEKLQCSEDDIETLFITSIEFGYLDALIDESKKIVYFRYFSFFLIFLDVCLRGI